MRSQPRTRVSAGPCTAAGRPPVRERPPHRCCLCQDCGAGRGYWSMRHSIRRKAAIPAPQNTHPFDHTHVLQRLQGRALRQGGRQRAHALRANSVVVKTAVQVAVLGPRGTASGARPPSLPPNRNPCGHAHVLERLQGRALRQRSRKCACALRAEPVGSKTVVPRLGYWPTRQSIRRKAAIPAPQIRTHSTTPTYPSVCRAVHCGSAVATTNATSSPIYQ